MVARLLDNCAVHISASTTSLLTLGDAVVTGKQFCLTFAQADAVDGETYAYKIIDGSGWELAEGIWSSADNTIGRTTFKSHDGRSYSTDPLTLSGRAFLAVVLRAADFATLGSLQDTIDAIEASVAAAEAAAAEAEAQATAAAASAASVAPAQFLKKAGGETDGAMTGPLNFARSTVASHATTADIWAASNQINFTGTATVTDFPDAPQAGAERTLICAGACTFTNNANIAVQGAANYTAAAGDIVTVYAMTLSTFRVTIERANGVPLPRAALGKVWTAKGANVDPAFEDLPAQPVPPMTLLATLTASSSAFIADTTSLTAAYSLYMIQIENLLPVIAAGIMQIRVSTNAGSTWETASYSNVSNSTTAAIDIGTSVNNSANHGGANGVLWIQNPAGASAYKRVTGTVSGLSLAQVISGCWAGATTAINGLQFLSSAGNLASGKVRIWGVKTS